MKKILMLLLLISCQKQKMSQSFEDRFYFKWMAATDIKINKQWQDSGEWFSRPYNAEVLLAEITFFKKKSYQLMKDCLYYKIPRRDKDDGHLSFYTIAQTENCGKVKKIKINLMEEITNLKMLYSDEDPIELKSYGKLKSFHLLFQIEKNKKVEKYLTALFNYKPKVNSSQYQQYSSNLSQGSIEGVMIHSVHLKRDKEERSMREELIGKFEDRFSEKSLKYCYKTDFYCNETISYHCSDCRYGFYEVASVCPTQNDKVCGIQKCGQKGELACPRGSTHQENKEKLGCVPNSGNGICEQGLIPTCLEKKYLVCL